MNIIPDWAPNVHPLIIHFPIAILFVAAFLDAVGLGMRRRLPGVGYVATGLYLLGAIALVIAFFTGRLAADGFDLPAKAVAAVGNHADWALWTVWVFGLYGLFRLGTVLWAGGRRPVVQIGLFFIGAAALILVQQTAERGARLVFDLGLGVQAAETTDADVAGSEHEHAGMSAGGNMGMAAATDTLGEMSASMLQTTADGAWRWTANAGTLPSLMFLNGEAADVAEEAVGVGVRLRPRRPVMFTVGDQVDGIQVGAILDMSGFIGRVALVHHVRDAENYDFLAIDWGGGSGIVRQGRVRDGSAETFADAVLDADTFAEGAVALRAVAHGTHFRGYMGGVLITHGHGKAAPAGAAGMLLDGTGTVQLLRLEAVPVAE